MLEARIMTTMNCTVEEARYIAAWMMLDYEHPVELDAAAFMKEAVFAADCVRMAGRSQSELLANFYRI